MLDIYAESLFIASRRDVPLRHAAAPLAARQGWLARLFFGRR